MPGPGVKGRPQACVTCRRRKKGVRAPFFSNRQDRAYIYANQDLTV